MKQTEILTHATHVNGWEPAVYMSCMSQNFRLFHVSNLSVRNFRIFLLMYTGSLSVLLDPVLPAEHKEHYTAYGGTRSTAPKHAGFDGNIADGAPTPLIAGEARGEGPGGEGGTRDLQSRGSSGGRK